MHINILAMDLIHDSRFVKAIGTIDPNLMDASANLRGGNRRGARGAPRVRALCLARSGYPSPDVVAGWIDWLPATKGRTPYGSHVFANC